MLSLTQRIGEVCLRSRLSLGLSLAAWASVGCGIPQKQHDATVAALRACQAEAQRLKGEQGGLVAEKARLGKALGQSEGERQALVRRLGASTNELVLLRQRQAEAARRAGAFKDLVIRLKAMIDSGKLDVRLRRGRMIVQLSDQILFDPGQVVLKSAGQGALQQLAHVLKDIDNRDFVVAGHTDNVPIYQNKRFRSNWELSAARAVAVVTFLQQQGVDPKRLAAAGYSEYDPVADNGSPEGRRSNRRIEIVLMPKLQQL